MNCIQQLLPSSFTTLFVTQCYLYVVLHYNKDLSFGTQMSLSLFFCSTTYVYENAILKYWCRPFKSIDSRFSSDLFPISKKKSICFLFLGKQNWLHRLRYRKINIIKMQEILMENSRKVISKRKKSTFAFIQDFSS